MQTNVLDWLDQTAELYPDKIAITDEKGSITYAQYRQQSLSVGRHIIEKKNQAGNKEKSPVLVFLEKSSFTLVSFMGIAYSGNFYSPIDIDMPGTRVNKILSTLNSEIVITTRALAKTFEKYDYHGA